LKNLGLTQRTEEFGMHPLRLTDAFKQFTSDQDKVRPPEETVRHLRERLSRVELDILKSTLRIDTGRLDIPVFISTCGQDALRVIGTRKQMGKGGTPAQAEASAVMELAERFSFFSFSKNPANFVTDTYPNLRERAIPFEMIAASVHDDSADVAVSRRLFEMLPLRWTEAWNLTRGDSCLVPFDWFFAINEFNGPSAGNCREEALLQGICEVVERHVSSLVSRNRIRVPLLRTDSVTDEVVRGMLAKYRRCGIRLFISDFSLDTGIPSIGVLAYDPATFPALSEIVWTAGTTPGPQKALSRALTEVAQLAGDFNTAANYVASGLPKPGRLEEVDYITASEGEKDIAELPDLSHPNFRIEVENCIGALARRGLEVLAVETTHPGLQIPAFYTIIPGAHFRERSRGTSVAMFAAKLLLEKKPPQEAEEILADFDARLPGKYYLRFYRGLCRLNAGDPQAALPLLREALDLDPAEPEIPSVYSYIGVALKESGRYAEALDSLAQGVRLDPERTDLHNLMGFCHYKLGEHEKAVAAFRKVIELDPSSAIDYANLGVNYQALGRRQDAITCYRMALQLDAGIDFARDRLAGLDPG
jgi:ribosomal protein S12 methylthiotransferase accessory factor